MKRTVKSLPVAFASLVLLAGSASAQLFTQTYTSGASISGSVWGPSGGPFSSAYSGTSADIRYNSGSAGTINLTDPATLGTIQFDSAGAGPLQIGTGFSGAGNTAIIIGSGPVRQANSDRFGSSAQATLGVTSGATFDLRNAQQSFTSLSGSGTITNNSASAGTNNLIINIAGTSTFDGIFTDSGSATVGTGDMKLTKSGVGTLILTSTSASNNFQGGTVVSNGTLKISSANALSSAASTVTNYLTLSGGGALQVADDVGFTSRTFSIGSGGGTLNVDSTKTLTLTSGAVTDGGSGYTLTKSGAGTLLQGTNDTFADTLNITVADGTLDFSTKTDTIAGLTLKAGTVTGTGGITVSSITAESGTMSAKLLGGSGVVFTKNTGGTVQVTNTNSTFTGGSVLNGGTVQIAGAGSLGSSGATAYVTLNGGTLQADATFSYTANNRPITMGTNGGGLSATTGNTFTVQSIISGGGGTGALTISGPGTVALSGASTYVGGTTLSSGTLQVGLSGSGSVGAINNSAIGTGTLALNGGTISSDGTSARIILNAVTIGGDVTLGNATNNGALAFNADVNLNGATRILTTASDAAFNGILSNGGLTKGGSGILTLTNNNTYTGRTTVNGGGTLLLGFSNRIADASAMTLNGGKFDTGGFSETVGALTLSDNSIIDMGSGNSILNFGASGGITWTGTLKIYNYTNPGTTAGTGTDRLYFGTDNTATSLTSTQLNSISFYSGAGTGLLGTGAFLGTVGEISFAAVPEPSTYIGGGLILGLAAWSRRKRRTTIR